MGKTSIGGKGIKAGQRTTRATAEVSEDGSSLSSTGFDRVQFGPASGAGALEGAIQQGNEQQLNALGDVSNRLDSVNGALSDLNSNMETLKKLETATLLFEFAKFGDFGKTFDTMDNKFESMGKTFDKMDDVAERNKDSIDANFDELIARTDAGSRSIVKAITRMHGMLSGDSEAQLKTRMTNTSASQNEQLMRARNVRDAQRKVYAKHGIYKVTGESPNDAREDFAKETRNASNKSKAREGLRIKAGQTHWEVNQVLSKTQGWAARNNREDVLNKVQKERKKLKARNKDFHQLQIFDHGDLASVKNSYTGPDGKRITTKGSRVVYNRDHNRKFFGGGGGGMNCCDDLVSILKDIEINTHVFREVKEEFKASFKKPSSMALRENANEVANRNRNLTIASQNTGLSSSQNKNPLLLGGPQRQEKYAGSNWDMIPYGGGGKKNKMPKGKPGLIKRFGQMLAKYGWAFAGYVIRIAPWLAPMFTPMGAAIAVGAAILFIQYQDDIIKLMDDYEANQKAIEAANKVKLENEKKGLVAVVDSETGTASNMSLEDAQNQQLEDVANGLPPSTIDAVAGGKADISNTVAPLTTQLIKNNAKRLKAQRIAEDKAKAEAEAKAAAEKQNVNLYDNSNSNNSTSHIVHQYGHLIDEMVKGGIDSTLRTDVPTSGTFTPGN